MLRPGRPGAAVSGQGFEARARVEHADWGQGTVLADEGDRLTVLFDDVGYQELAASVVLEEELLSPGRSGLPFGNRSSAGYCGPPGRLRNSPAWHRIRRRTPAE
jgi:hypothetical protein